MSIYRQNSRELYPIITRNHGQINSLHISRKLSRELDNKMEMAQCINDIIKKSHRKINNVLSKSKFQQSSKSLKKELCSQEGEKIGLKKLQDKIAKLKNRIFPE